MAKYQKRQVEFDNDTQKTAYLQNLIFSSGIESAKSFITDQTDGNLERIAEIDGEIEQLQQQKQQLKQDLNNWGKLLMQAGQNVMKEQMKSFGITPEPVKPATASAAGGERTPGKRLTKSQMQELTDKVIEILRENRGIGKPEVESKLTAAGYTDINVSQLLSKLKKEGRIIGSGGKRDMTYRVA